MKLPKIDIKKVKKKNLQNIFYTDMHVNKVNKNDNLTMKHTILIDNKPYITGESQLLVFNDNKQVVWLRFYPFNHIKQESEIISENMKISELEHNVSVYKQAIDDNKEMFNGYRIISSSIDKKIEPIALIKNYFRQGLGTIAQFNILENMMENLDSKVADYTIRHTMVSIYRRKQLGSMGINEFCSESALLKYAGINTDETVKDYYIKSEEYAKLKGLI